MTITATAQPTTTTALDVAYDGRGDEGMLHFWTNGGTWCDVPVKEPVVFTTTLAAVVDIFCVRCELAARDAVSGRRTE